MALLVAGAHRALEHKVMVPHGRWTKMPNPMNRRMVNHVSPFEGPFIDWLMDRPGSWDMESRIDGMEFGFSNRDTAMEFKMRFG